MNCVELTADEAHGYVAGHFYSVTDVCKQILVLSTIRVADELVLESRSTPEDLRTARINPSKITKQQCHPERQYRRRLLLARCNGTTRNLEKAKSFIDTNRYQLIEHEHTKIICLSFRMACTPHSGSVAQMHAMTSVLRNKIQGGVTGKAG